MNKQPTKADLLRKIADLEKQIADLTAPPPLTAKKGTAIMTEAMSQRYDDARNRPKGPNPRYANVITKARQ